MEDVEAAVRRLGGVARRGQLRRAVSRRRLGRAVRAGRIVRTGHGRYALPLTDATRVAASRLTGVASHTSAALHWGWAVKTVPAHPHVTVPRHRKLTAARREDVTAHWRDLAADDVVDSWVTSPVRTVIDCCLDLPFDEALAVFDSSWRAGLKPKEVQLAAMALPRRSRDRVLAVARAADPRAANPFESVLRAIALGVRGLRIQPQYEVRHPGFYARVDLADELLRLVIEADSWTFHTSRTAFDRDCRRYNALVADHWRVVRFTWEQVMFDPDYVRAVLQALVDHPTRAASTGSRADKSAIRA